MDLDKTKEILFPAEFDKALSASQRFSAEIRRKVLEFRKVQSFQGDTDGVEEKFRDISKFMREYVEKVGKEQAVRDFQHGLNILCEVKTKRLTAEKIPLEEDGDFGEKTCSALLYACRHFDIQVILHALRQGAINNAAFDGQCDEEIEEINSDLEVGQ
jgi:hypothetical protein